MTTNDTTTSDLNARLQLLGAEAIGFLSAMLTVGGIESATARDTASRIVGDWNAAMKRSEQE